MPASPESVSSGSWVTSRLILYLKYVGAVAVGIAIILLLSSFTIQGYLLLFDTDTQTHLHTFVKAGNIENLRHAIETLRASNGDINARWPFTKTALMLASVVGNADAVSLLLDADADSSYTDANGASALHLAVQGNDIPYHVISRLRCSVISVLCDSALKKSLALPKSKSAVTLLGIHSHDVFDLSLSVIRYADEATTDAHRCMSSILSLLDMKDGNFHTFALRLAYISAEKGLFDIFDLVLARIGTFNSNEKDRHGRTLLHGAAVGGNVDIINLLLSRKADINAGGPNGESPVHVAASSGNVAAMQLLLQRGASVTLTANHGYNIVHYAVLGGHVEVLLNLLDTRHSWYSAAQRLIHSANHAKNSAIHIATAAAGLTEDKALGMVEILIQHGASTVPKGYDGLSVVEMANRAGRQRIVNFYENRAKELTAANHEGGEEDGWEHKLRHVRRSVHDEV